MIGPAFSQRQAEWTGFVFQLLRRTLCFREVDTNSKSNVASDCLGCEEGSFRHARSTGSNTRSIATNCRTIVRSLGITSPILLLQLTYATSHHPLLRRTTRSCRIHNRSIEFVRFVFDHSFQRRQLHVDLPRSGNAVSLLFRNTSSRALRIRSSRLTAFVLFCFASVFLLDSSHRFRPPSRKEKTCRSAFVLGDCG